MLTLFIILSVCVGITDTTTPRELKNWFNELTKEE